MSVRVRAVAALSLRCCVLFSLRVFGTRQSLGSGQVLQPGTFSFRVLPIGMSVGPKKRRRRTAIPLMQLTLLERRLQPTPGRTALLRTALCTPGE